MTGYEHFCVVAIEPFELPLLIGGDEGVFSCLRDIAPSKCQIAEHTFLALYHGSIPDLISALYVFLDKKDCVCVFRLTNDLSSFACHHHSAIQWMDRMIQSGNLPR
jgi:hypothetical protein